MAPQSYELTFVGSVFVIFITIVLFIVAANLFVAICRYLWRKLLGRTAQLRSMSTQTVGVGEGDGVVVNTAQKDKSSEVETSATGSAMKKKQS